MICPKCGKDAGEAKFCPECGENLSAPSENETKTEIVQENKTVAKPKKKIKKIWILLAIVVAVVAFFGIKSIVKSAKPAKYVSWNTIYSDTLDNAKIAEKKYSKEKLIFYVYVTEIGNDAEVEFFDSNWNKPNISFEWGNKNSVFFDDYSGLHTGNYYVIEGYIYRLYISTTYHPTKPDESKLGVHIEDAKIKEAISR